MTVTTNNMKNSLITLSCFSDCPNVIQDINRICDQESVLNTIFKLSFSVENSFYKVNFINENNKEKMKDYFNKDTIFRFDEKHSNERLEHFDNLLRPFNFISLENTLINEY